MNYYKRHIGDYAKKAGHLSVLEHGVYTLLLDAYYDREQAPTRAEAIRQARARTPEEVAAVDAVLADFFTLDGDRYTQRRVEEEFVKAEEVAKLNAAKGKLGGRPRKPKGKPTESRQLSDAKPDESPEKPNPLIHQSTNPPTEKQEPAQPAAAPSPKRGRKFTSPDCPDGVADQVWQDWLTLRRAKNAPVTETVLTAARREAEAAGMPLERFLAVWCNRGSQGLEASWLKPHERAGPNGQPQPSRQAQGVAAILGVNANDLIAEFTRGTLVQGSDRNVPCDLVPAESRRLPGG